MQRASKAAVGDSILKDSFTEGFDEGRPREEDIYQIVITVGGAVVFDSEEKQSKIGEVIQENIVRHAGEIMEIFLSPVYVAKESQKEVEDGIEDAEVVEE